MLICITKQPHVLPFHGIQWRSNFWWSGLGNTASRVTLLRVKTHLKLPQHLFWSTGTKGWRASSWKLPISVTLSNSGKIPGLLVFQSFGINYNSFLLNEAQASPNIVKAAYISRPAAILPLGNPKVWVRGQGGHLTLGVKPNSTPSLYLQCTTSGAKWNGRESYGVVGGLLTFALVHTDRGEQRGCRGSQLVAGE